MSASTENISGPEKSHGVELTHHDYVYAKAQAHSTPARQLVFANGIINLVFGLSVMFLPKLFYDGMVAGYISKITGMASPTWEGNPSTAFGVAALMMGFAFAAITAGQSDSNDAYRSIAALNGASGAVGLLACLISPNLYGSTFLLFTSMQNLVWYAVIVHFGDFGYMDCFGLSTRGLYVLEESLARDVLKHTPHPSHFVHHGGGEKAGVN